MNKGKMITLIFIGQIFSLALLCTWGIVTYNHSSSVFSSPEKDYSGEMMMADEDISMLESTPHSVRKAFAQSASAVGRVGSSLMIQNAHAEENSNYIIKTGNLRGRVEKIQDIKPQISPLLQEHKAHIFSENESNSNRQKSLNLQVKVPAPHFDALLDGLSQLAAHVDSKSSNLQDVMKEYIENEERIKSQELLRKKFRNLLTQSKRVEDSIKIEQQLSSIQRQIESTKRVLKNLKNRIALSTIQVTFYEEKPLIEQKNPVGWKRQIGDALSGGWLRLKKTFLFMISVWPFLLIALLGFWLYRKFWK